jgi:hypothetical protein
VTAPNGAIVGEIPSALNLPIRLPLPSALPVGDADLLPGGAGAAASGRRGLVACHLY